MTDITEADRRLAEQRQRHDRIFRCAPDNMRDGSIDELDTSELISGDEQLVRDAADRRLETDELGVEIDRYIESEAYRRLRKCLARGANDNNLVAQTQAALFASKPRVSNEDVPGTSDRDFGIGYRDVARLIRFADLVRARTSP